MQLGEQSYMMINKLLALDKQASKLVTISKDKLRDNQHNDAEIYPEVHFPMEASLHWSGAVLTKVKHRIAVIWLTVISFVSFHRCGEARITMLPLRSTTRTFTRMRHTPQLGGSSPNAPSHQNSMLQGRGTHHNLIGGSRRVLQGHKSLRKNPQALELQRAQE